MSERITGVSNLIPVLIHTIDDHALELGSCRVTEISDIGGIVRYEVNTTFLGVELHSGLGVLVYPSRSEEVNRQRRERLGDLFQQKRPVMPKAVRRQGGNYPFDNAERWDRGHD